MTKSSQATLVSRARNAARTHALQKNPEAVLIQSKADFYANFPNFGGGRVRLVEYFQTLPKVTGALAATPTIKTGQHTTVAASDTVVTGLALVTAVVASLDSDTGDDPLLVTASIGDQAGTPAAGSILIKTWKTDGADPTPVAATTFTKKVNWIAVGTVASGSNGPANFNFEILGSGGSSDDVTHYAEGGMKMETDGGGANSVILLPHLTSGTAWTNWTWGTDRSVEWGCVVRLGQLTACKLWAGLKLTNTATVGTDDDQAFFKYDSAHATLPTKLVAVYSIGGTDVEYDTGVVMEADVEYDLRVLIDSQRAAHFVVNGEEVLVTAALTDAVDLIPYIGIIESAAAAKNVKVYAQAISRACAA